MTQRQYPFVPIGEFAKPVSRPEAVVPGRTYRQIGVHWWGKGVYEREATDGARTRYQTLYRVQTDDIVFNKIWARHGSAAIVPDSLDGCYGSGEFPTFEPNQDKLDPRWFHWIAQTKGFWERCADKSYGTSGKNRIQPQKILEIEIPLPPLPEQQRIVARIEALAGKIEAARGLRGEAAQAGEALVPSVLHQLFGVETQGWKRLTMSEVVTVSARQVDPTIPEYAQLPHINGSNIEKQTCRLLPYGTASDDGMTSNKYHFHSNTILYSKIRPYLRKAVFVDFEGLCSADIYPLKVIHPELDPEFVMWSLVASPFTNYANRVSGRTRMPKLNRQQLGAYELEFPSKQHQRVIVERLNRLRKDVSALRVPQEHAQRELNALLPAVLDRAFRGEL